MSFIKLTDLDLAGKRVLIRADLNVPVKDGKVTSDARITASMPTIEHCMKAGAKVMVFSHRGRPQEGVVDEENSMQPIADDMSAKLGKTVPLVKDYMDNAPQVGCGRGGAVGECPFQRGRGQGQRRPGQEIRRLVRRLRDGRLRHRPPGPGLHPWCRQVRAGGLCRAVAGRGARCPQQGARQTRRVRWSPSSAAPRSPPS